METTQMHSLMTLPNGPILTEMGTEIDQLFQTEISSLTTPHNGAIWITMVLEMIQMGTTETNARSFTVNPQYLQQEGAQTATMMASWTHSMTSRMISINRPTRMEMVTEITLGTSLVMTAQMTMARAMLLAFWDAPMPTKMVMRTQRIHSLMTPYNGKILMKMAGEIIMAGKILQLRMSKTLVH